MTQSRTYVSPKRAAQSRETSQRILAAARTLFAVQGYAGTTIEAVAREAGVSAPTVYQRFGDKVALLRGQIDDIDREADLSALLAVQNDDQAPARVQVQALARFVGRVSEIAAPLVVATRALNDPQLKAVYDDGMDRHRRGTAGLAAQWAARGLLRDGLSSDAAGTTLAAVCSIAMFLELQETHGLSRETAEAWIVDATLRLLLKDAAAA